MDTHKNNTNTKTNNLIIKGISSSNLAIGILCLGLISCSQIPALGQTSLSGELRMNGKKVEAAFEAQRQVLQDSSAAIYIGRKPIGYGVIMSTDGYILTKRSELFLLDPKTKKSTLKENLQIIIGANRYPEVTLLTSNTEWDLAILKINASNLTPVQWAESPDITQGSWVITNASTSKSRRRVNIGIISANSRKIKGKIPVVLGIGLKGNDHGVEITAVTKKSGAEAAGMLKGDFIKTFAGVEVTKREQILDIIREKQPGDFIEVEFLRKSNGKTKMLKQKIELKPRKEIAGETEAPKNRNDQMSGDYSERRNSFPMVLQHDIDQSSRQIGGPLLNLAGKAVGINIARVNRAESFAIPAKEAQQVYQEMLKTITE